MHSESKTKGLVRKFSTLFQGSKTPKSTKDEDCDAPGSLDQPQLINEEDSDSDSPTIVDEARQFIENYEDFSTSYLHYKLATAICKTVGYYGRRGTSNVGHSHLMAGFELMKR